MLQMDAMRSFGDWLPRVGSKEAWDPLQVVQLGPSHGVTMSWVLGRRVQDSGGHREVPQALLQWPRSGPKQNWVLPADGSSIQGDTGDKGTVPHLLHSCSKEASGSFGIPAQSPLTPHPSPHPLFPSLAPSCCPGHSPRAGVRSLLFATRGLLVFCLQLSTHGHCGGDSSTHT